MDLVVSTVVKIGVPPEGSPWVEGVNDFVWDVRAGSCHTYNPQKIRKEISYDMILFD